MFSNLREESWEKKLLEVFLNVKWNEKLWSLKELCLWLEKFNESMGNFSMAFHIFGLEFSQKVVNSNFSALLRQRCSINCWHFMIWVPINSHSRCHSLSNGKNSKEEKIHEEKSEQVVSRNCIIYHIWFFPWKRLIVLFLYALQKNQHSLSLLEKAHIFYSLYVR